MTFLNKTKQNNIEPAWEYCFAFPLQIMQNIDLHVGFQTYQSA